MKMFRMKSMMSLEGAFRMADNNKKAASYIGLAKKSGRLVSGEYMVEKTIKEGKAELVIVAADASENTKKNFNLL